ncbi:MAG: Veg family protein [Erysipelotrichaceae bacterium]|nr:Veg family protein [Erysipelotrichaceae bacterium]
MANKKKELRLSQNIEVVRNQFRELINSSVIVEDRFSRSSKTIKGELIAVYDNIIVVKMDNDSLYVNRTYSYSDIISGKIKISKEVEK